MALNIIELFGYPPSDKSSVALRYRNEKRCPFIDAMCTKSFNDGEISGVCTVKQTTSAPVICCPNRMYAQSYKILSDTAKTAFGQSMKLYPGNQAIVKNKGKKSVAVFGKGWGRELRLPSRGNRGGYFVDWILALINKQGDLSEFVAVEVQSIDTTGTYRKERDSYMRGEDFQGSSNAGLNWENVSKRILPQLIYKGHVLRREMLCRKGLFFICPTAIYGRVLERLGGNLLDYPLQPGSLTFRWYDIDIKGRSLNKRKLVNEGQLVTTIDQVANAFTNPSNLPDAGVYEQAIRKALEI